MANKKECLLTSEGYLEVEQELNELKTVRRPEIIKALKEARALGDLSENADYDAARNEQAQVEARIQDLEYMIEHATIITNATKNKVGVGSSITIKYIEDDEEEEYKIVGSLEADPFENKISNESPIGKAVIGKKVDDIVDIESPTGSYQIKITKIA